MAANVSLLTMRTEVRRLANAENESAALTDAELNSQINYHLRNLYNAMCMAGAEVAYTSKSFTTLANQSAYPFASAPLSAADFFMLKSIDVGDGSRTINGIRFGESERNLFKAYPWAYAWPVCFRRQGANLVIMPAPAAGYTITLNYYPTFTALAADGSLFDGINGFEQYAIFMTVAYALAKEESDPSFWRGEADRIMADVKQMAAMLDASEPERITDVYATRKRWR